jgi:hypothetical protein
MRRVKAVRAAVEAVDREVALLVELERSAVSGGRTLEALRVTWAGLQDLLGFEPMPEPLRCPHCGRVGTFEEIHCWTCWEELVPWCRSVTERLEVDG